MVLIKKAAYLCVSALFLAGVANATYIDFSSPLFSSVNGKNSIAIVDAGGPGTGINLTLNADALGSLNLGLMSQSSDDGLGIRSLGLLGNVEADEITGTLSEQLNISLDSDLLSITRVDLSNLYYEKVLFNFYDYENGSYSVNGSNIWSTFSAAQGLPTGALSLTMPEGVIKSFSIKANKDLFSDFSVKGIEVSPVPEPGIISILGFGFLALSGVSFFRRKK
jgi:hypothetical protein